MVFLQSFPNSLENICVGASFFKLKAVCSCFEVPWCCLEKPSTSVKMQKYPSRGVLRKKYSENMLQIYRKTPMPKCDFNSAWVFSCKFAAYLQNILFQEHLWMTASENEIHPGYWPDNSTKFSEELLNSFMTGVVNIKKPVHWFAPQIKAIW